MSPPPDFGSEGSHEAQGLVAGVATAIVVSNTDPDQLGRVKLHLPWRSDDFETEWARIAVPMGGPDHGTYFLPDVGDEVLVAFDRDDIRYPYVLGALWSRTDKVPEKNDDGKNSVRLIKTRAGHVLRFDDSDRSSILIRLADGKKVEVNDQGIQIDDGTNKIVLDAKAGTIAIEAKQSLSLKAPNIAIQATATLDIKGGQSLSAAATIVRIN